MTRPTSFMNLMQISTFRARLIKIILFFLLLLPTYTVTQAQDSVVYGIFFYSPTCGHCHEVLDNHWTQISDEFGDQLRVLFVDASTPEGGQLMNYTVMSMNIPSNGVPMLILGDQFLVGSIDIPQRAPIIIRDALQNDGIGYPPVEGIDAVFESVFGESMVTVETAPPVISSPSFSDDPANILAVIVLVGLVASTVLILSQIAPINNNPLQNVIQSLNVNRWLPFIGAIFGALLTGSLLIGSFDNQLTLVLSSIVFLFFLFASVIAYQKPNTMNLSQWIPPVMMVSGLLVAGYLAYIETTLTEPTCGIVGNCHVVQQSDYAQILGVSIGVIGVIGYGAVLLVWLAYRYTSNITLNWLLFGVILAGVAFSTYLTFLEPFVIGASCVWCLTSAVIMTLLLWVSIPEIKTSQT